ncbi:hypothetical protein Pla123a_37170 [Posidoniimonas polymericola]|uniref:PilZ domain-containing protein n=1 Tax=Posidoniimonas polymericola TaxID=2528002 RepID=A0A5C5YG30_9BACT|nr:PilZ domain-containing protein [Posidoniimonas polymericola]TWT73823.1 hypothetical protein Pla123a_37170 [Posidoniimonas polymericola]
MTNDPWQSVVATVDMGAISSAATRPGASGGHDLRRRPRKEFPCRSQLTLDSRPGSLLGVSCRDISQTGVAVYSPCHALPLEQGVVTLHEGRTLRVRVRHCKRIGARCFLLGCDFEVDANGGPLAVFADTLSGVATV